MENRLAHMADERIIEALPHGSGIDCAWEIMRHNNGNVDVHNSFHMMDENGCYCGYQDFRVRIYIHSKDVLHPLSGPFAGKAQVLHKAGAIDCDVFSVGRWTYRARMSDLQSYLAETVQWALSEAGIVDHLGTEVIDL